MTTIRELEVKCLNFINCIFNSCNMKNTCIGCELSDGDMKVLKHVGVLITQ
jgi:hypothetical protein